MQDETLFKNNDQGFIMKKNNLRNLLIERWRTKKGLPAFNYSDMWDLFAIVNAANRENVDIIVASNPLVVEALGMDICQSMVNGLNAKSNVSLFNHLDHSSSVDLCIEAIDSGYPSVMIDGSRKALEDNIRMTKEVVKYAHKKGVLTEGEIGKIKGKGIEGDFSGGVYMAEIDEAVELVEKTNVDMLAVGIGTAHGFYTEKPEINFDRIKEIAAVLNVPLVLHGGTGIPDEDIQKAISLGIIKVNVGTYLTHLKRALDRADENPYTLDIMKEVLPYIEGVVSDRIKIITGV